MVCVEATRKARGVVNRPQRRKNFQRATIERQKIAASMILGEYILLIGYRQEKSPCAMHHSFGVSGAPTWVWLRSCSMDFSSSLMPRVKLGSLRR